MTRRISEEYIREEVGKLFFPKNKDFPDRNPASLREVSEVNEILYHLRNLGISNFTELRRRSLKIPEGHRLKYIGAYVMGALPDDDANLNLAVDLFQIFSGDYREILRTNFPDPKKQSALYTDEYFNVFYIGGQPFKKGHGISGPLVYK